MLNMSSYSGMHWLLLGVMGQVAFFLRMAVQWIVTEKRRVSTVPPIFWWFSICGGVMLMIYFVWRKDIVGVVGQSTGVLVYARNLWFIHFVSKRSQPPN
ncbi:MAG: lipid A biosynthesis protein [Phycisphaeraceae bacterium]|nr:MAG: lipid A biosynthesis protein [Phycisphaeraceae bacterium]